MKVLTEAVVLFLLGLMPFHIFASPFPTTTKSPSSLIIDIDLDFEDITAIASLKKQQQFSTIAVTMVCTGLGRCENSNNIKGIYSLLGMPAPAIGSGRSFVPKFPSRQFPLDWRHSADNLYNLLETPMGKNEIDAVELIWSELQKLPDGQAAVILALGPLTNISDLLEKYPQAEEKIAGMYIMGGAITVTGNVAYDDPNDYPEYHLSEWNIFLDPESAANVLGKAHNFPVYLVPLDPSNSLPYNKAVFDQFGELANKTSSAAVVYSMLKKNPQFYNDTNNIKYFWNTLTTMLMMNESLLTDPETVIKQCQIAIDTSESSSSGQASCVGEGAVNVVIQVPPKHFYQQLFDFFAQP